MVKDMSDKNLYLMALRSLKVELEHKLIWGDAVFEYAEIMDMINNVDRLIKEKENEHD